MLPRWIIKDQAELKRIKFAGWMDECLVPQACTANHCLNRCVKPNRAYSFWRNKKDQEGSRGRAEEGLKGWIFMQCDLKRGVSQRLKDWSVSYNPKKWIEKVIGDVGACSANFYSTCMSILEKYFSRCLKQLRMSGWGRDSRPALFVQASFCRHSSHN